MCMCVCECVCLRANTRTNTNTNTNTQTNSNNNTFAQLLARARAASLGTNQQIYFAGPKLAQAMIELVATHRARSHDNRVSRKRLDRPDSGIGNRDSRVVSCESHVGTPESLASWQALAPALIGPNWMLI